MFDWVTADALAYRVLLGRVVRYLVIATGIPKQDNVHEVAQREAPEARVVYVELDRCKSSCAHELTWPSGLTCT